MKKLILGIVVVAFILAGRSVLAEEMKGSMMEKGEMKGMCPIHAAKMKSMTAPSIVTTSDGGVIVLSGRTLTKYDKNLNVLKEVEINFSQEGMGKMMEKDGKCPICAVKRGQFNGEEGIMSAPQDAPAGEELDHARHH